MDDPSFRSLYHKCKCKVKLWEKGFRKKHGRIPSKYDIRDSSADVRDAYKMYYKLKTTLLENTLQDVLDDEDDFDSSLVSQMESRLSQGSSVAESSFSNIGELKASNVSISSLLTDQITEQVKEFEAEQELEQNTRAWGKELNRKKSTEAAVQKKPQVKPKVVSLTKQLIDVSSMVPSRNPRKSLTSRLSSSSLLPASGQTSFGSGSWKDSLPDLETLLNEKSKQAQQTSPVQNSSGSQQTKMPINQLDEGWLNRQSATQTDAISPAASQNVSQPKKYGLGNINLQRLDSSNAAPLDYSNSFGLSSLSMNSAINVSDDSRILAQSTAYDRSIESDSDGVVENSEDESTGGNGLMNKTTNIRHVTKKRKVFTSLNLKTKGKEILASDIANTEEMKNHVDVENLDPATKENVETKVKPGRKKRPPKAKPSISKAPVRRMPTRARKSVSYQLQNASDDEAITNAFGASDDDDKDPDFKDKKENLSDLCSNEDITANESSGIVEPEAVVEIKRRGRSRKTEPKLGKNASVPSSARGNSSRKRRSGSAKKSPAAPRIGGNIGKGKRKTTKREKAQPANKEREEETQEQAEEFNEYVLEFGVENLNNVPRIELSELKMSNLAAESFIQGALAGETGFKSKGDHNVVSQKETALKKKVAAGKLNENFVRIDIRKKVYVKGKKTVNYSKYKKALWKKKKAAALSGPEMDMGGCDGGVLTCFQCGGVGHMARNCKVKGEQLLPLEAVGPDESPFPTLEEAESMAKAKSLVVHANRIQNLPTIDNPMWKENPKESGTIVDSATNESEELPLSPKKPSYIRHTIPEDFLKASGILEHTVGSKDKIEPLYQLRPGGLLPATPKEVFDALQMFGHKQFRAGQERAIMRILSGMSTLVTLSTGSGKSLCYQLPAYLYRKQRKCVTLVISPLVSLMEDQVHGVPSFLNAQCLHTNQTPKVREKTMAAITSGELDVLLISPEAVVSGEKSTGFGSLLRQLPPIAFACIDEAHCVSQWSHNFRPSYLMICRVLKEKLGVQTILGLTATATAQTRLSIVEHLAIPDGTEGIISDIPLPDNLILSVSKDMNRDAALLNLLHTSRFSDLRSIIVYCTRRDECERLAAFLRTCFQDVQRTEMDAAAAGSGTRKRKRENCIAEPYHAGLPASRRKSIQNAFMRGDLRIVVATIAFGMGINKSDIRAIIHYNMPRNFESYVQEVGRAGRDGNTAHCHLFLDSKGNDRNELRRHIYANSIDRHVIRKLLQKVFVPCACVKNFKDEKFSEEHRKQIDALKDIDWSDDFPQTSAQSKSAVVKTGRTAQRVCPGHEVCFSIESTVQQLDIPEENISTLLCYLELHEQRYIQVLSRAYIMCKVMSYAGPRALRAAAKECPPLAMAIALDLKKGKSHDAATFIEFQVIDVAAAIGWDSGVVKFQLKNLEWTIENNVRKRSPISVSFYDLGFRIRAPGDLSDDELDTNLDSLYSRVTNQEKTQLVQLQCVFDALSSVAFQSYVPAGDTGKLVDSSNKLKQIIRAYFENDVGTDNMEFIPEIDDTPEHQLLNDIRTMVQRYPENNFTGRSIARIFHGVQSPNFPAVIWGRCNYWRAHTGADFNRIVRLANAEIMRMRI